MGAFPVSKNGDHARAPGFEDEQPGDCRRKQVRKDTSYPFAMYTFEDSYLRDRQDDGLACFAAQGLRARVPQPQRGARVFWRDERRNKDVGKRLRRARFHRTRWVGFHSAVQEHAHLFDASWWTRGSSRDK